MRLIGLLLIALGVWGLTLDKQSPRPVERALTDETTLLAEHVPADPKVLDTEEFDAILQRPLFSPQRRPFSAPEPVPQPLAPPRIRLSAISVSNSVRVAVIRELDTNRTQYVREGAQLGQWVVEKVDLNKVILRSKDQTITIPLFGGG